MTMAQPGGHSFQQEQVPYQFPSSSSFYSSSSSYSSFHYSPRTPRYSYPPPEINQPLPAQPFLDDGDDDAQFDIFEWHQYFKSCLRYFLEHAQYNGPVQALAAFINIQLPFQRAAAQNLLLLPHRAGSSPSVGAMPGSIPTPLAAGAPTAAATAAPGAAAAATAAATANTTTSLQPYIRRLVATGFDFPAVLHGFFGDDWQRGVGRLHEQERRNYLFAAKSSSWLEVKRAYDRGAGGGGGGCAGGCAGGGGGGGGGGGVGGVGSDDEAVPFLKPLKNVSEQEIVAAEARWSEWLAMQDWMLGPRAPDRARRQQQQQQQQAREGHVQGKGKVHIKREEDA